MRGVIENRNRARQIIDFRNLRFGNITPTDLDGVIEYRNKAYIYYEYKYLDAPTKDGQRLYLSRQVNDIWKAGKYAIALILVHDIHSAEIDIQAEKAIVREFFFNPKKGWVQPRQKENALELTQRFLKWIDDGANLGA